MTFDQYFSKVPFGTKVAWLRLLSEHLNMSLPMMRCWAYRDMRIIRKHWKDISQFTREDESVKGFISVKDLEKAYSE